MIKFILRFALSLIILLSSGCILVFDHYYSENTNCSSAKDLECSPGTSFTAARTDYGQITQSSSSCSERNVAIEVAEKEIEEDELSSSRKYFQLSSYFTDPFHPLTHAHLFQHLKGRFPFSGHFCYLSSYGSLYIIFLVFRVWFKSTRKTFVIPQLLTIYFYSPGSYSSRLDDCWVYLCISLKKLL